MTLVSIYSFGEKLRCEMNKGASVAEGDAKTVLGALMKTYFKLMVSRTMQRIYTWRKIWTEH